MRIRFEHARPTFGSRLNPRQTDVKQHGPQAEGLLMRDSSTGLRLAGWCQFVTFGIWFEQVRACARAPFRFVEVKQGLIACQIVWDGLSLVLVNSGNDRTCLFYSYPYFSCDRQQTNQTMEVDVRKGELRSNGRQECWQQPPCSSLWVFRLQAGSAVSQSALTAVDHLQSYILRNNNENQER